VEEIAEGDGRGVALENARRKAREVSLARPASLVIGCDTVVALGERLLGKPPDEETARKGLVALSGREHEVTSGLCVIGEGEERVATTSTQVEFRPLEPALIDWYLDTGEWRGRAGGYAIQSRGAALVAGIRGDYSNVVGLPLAALQDLVPGLLA